MAGRDPNIVVTALRYEDSNYDEQEQMNQSDDDLERTEENNNNDIDDNLADHDYFIHDRNDKDPVAEGGDSVSPKPVPFMSSTSSIVATLILLLPLFVVVVAVAVVASSKVNLFSIVAMC